MSRVRSSSKSSFNATGSGTSNKPSMKNREHPSVPTNTFPVLEKRGAVPAFVYKIVAVLKEVFLKYVYSP